MAKETRSETSKLIVREATEEDIGSIFKILNYEILNTTATFDQVSKSDKDIQLFFNKHDRKIYPFFVAEKISEVGNDSVEIVGWSRLSPWSPKPSYRISADISIYVDNDYQGQGIGQLLLAKLIDHSSANGIQVLIAQISAENHGSIQFHIKAGFKKAGILEKVGLKFGRVLDVLIMQRFI